jgi:hypothetical protein
VTTEEFEAEAREARPLRLPAEKYAIWKDFVIGVSP